MDLAIHGGHISKEEEGGIDLPCQLEDRVSQVNVVTESLERGGKSCVETNAL